MSVPAPPPAWIELDGVDNMRDLGGLPTLDGRQVQPGRLIRSDNLQDLSPTAVDQLVHDLGVTDVVDLRTLVEVAREGDGPLVGEPGVEIHHLTLYAEDSAETGIPAGERELPWVRDPNLGDDPPPVAREKPDHDTYWSEHYLGYLAHRPDSVVAALRAIADAPGAVVCHCAAGKDRTGTIVGLALLLVGVTPEAVAADFAASDERVPRILARLARHPVYTVNLEGKTAEQQGTRAGTMTRMLAALEARGGVEAVLAEHGWTSEDTARLKAKLLAA